MCACLARFVIIATVCLAVSTAEAQLWRHLTGRGEQSSDERAADISPRTAAKFVPTAGGDFSLAQESGPWLIVAASFSGDGAQEQANALAEELRFRHRMTAYVHEMNFKFGEESPGRGLDEYGAPVRRRFSRGDEVRELAVLVGDFSSVDDPQAQQTLQRIKTLTPDALNVDAAQSAQSMAEVRRWQDAVREKLGKAAKRGPMAQAFMSRNPLLPPEYFVPKGVDPFVAKMNSGVDHSLLDCPDRFTIQVATFRGRTILQTSTKETPESNSFWNRRRAAENDPLVEAAENAHLLTEELRAHGWEAYEFHDRTESIVTIGSFSQVAQALPDGRVLADPAVEKIVKTFGAAYDTPADPLTPIGNDATTQRMVEQQEQQFNLQLNSQQAQIVPGMNPKHVKILKGRGKRARVERIIPMDVNPKAIEVPRRSVSSAYAG
jgi:hypothetical protein